MSESLVNKVASLQACNFIKKGLQHRCFLANIAKLLSTNFTYFWVPILKKICASGTLGSNGLTQLYINKHELRVHITFAKIIILFKMDFLSPMLPIYSTLSIVFLCYSKWYGKLLTSFCCLYSQLWPDFTHCSGVSTVNFEQVNASWATAFIFNFAQLLEHWGDNDDE